MSRLGTISLSTNGLILRFVGDTLVIETTDLDELRHEVTRALGDEPLSVQEAARHLKLSVKTIRNRIKDGTLQAKMVGGAGTAFRSGTWNKSKQISRVRLIKG